MKELIQKKLKNSSIYMGDVGKTIKEICNENNTKLKRVNANLDNCTIIIETENEKFDISYNFFNPVIQCFVFN